jgi:A/G-specific adenine glycosylase
VDNVTQKRTLKIKYFQKSILEWYKINGRNFIWRKESSSNYEIIIAEIFLQRTKAETVNAFLPSFYKKYSSWVQLAKAPENELKEVIKPLGLYNQRGARLFRLAQRLAELKGHFPSDRALLEEMPMMGQYLVNAFELYILNRPSPLLDVNMARLLERYFGSRKLSDIRFDPYLQDLAIKVVNHPSSKEINWAILDFSALVCKSSKPNCQSCILSLKCQFRKNMCL